MWEAFFSTGLYEPYGHLSTELTLILEKLSKVVTPHILVLFYGKTFTGCGK